MTATCREACCSVQPRRTISELFERGYRRNRAAALSIEGARHANADGNSARFSLDAADGKIIGVGFRATTCATLIAYCEYIAEVVPGFRLEIARELTAAQLVDSVPGVPPLKHDRAVLAITAFRASLAAAALQPIATGEARNEGRLHLRHPAP
jgi:NifU-like protein involved in Fe-S cluster formation